MRHWILLKEPVLNPHFRFLLSLPLNSSSTQKISSTSIYLRQRTSAIWTRNVKLFLLNKIFERANKRRKEIFILLHTCTIISIVSITKFLGNREKRFRRLSNELKEGNVEIIIFLRTSCRFWYQEEEEETESRHCQEYWWRTRWLLLWNYFFGIELIFTSNKSDKIRTREIPVK